MPTRATAGAVGVGLMVLLTASSPVDPQHHAALRPAAVPMVKGPQQLGVDGGAAGSLSVISYRTVAALVGAQLIITRNAGAHWSVQPLPKGTVGATLSFVSASTGWVVAYGGHNLTRLTVYKTRNGGQTWTAQIHSGPTDVGGSLDMTSPQVGWVTLGSTLYRTTDGGTHWTPITLPAGDRPGSLRFLSADRGWLSVQSRSSYAVLATQNGKRFSAILTGPNPYGGLWLQPGGRGYVLKGLPGGGPGFGSIIHTSNDGKTWSTVSTLKTLASLGFATGFEFSGSTGWIGTTNGALGFTPTGLMVTANGGATWHAVGASDHWAIEDLALTGPNSGWILGSSNEGGLPFLARTRDNGAHWSMVWPPANPSSMDFTTARTGYGMGTAWDYRAMVATHDGGRTWTVQTTDPPKLFNSYAFSKSAALAVDSTYRGPSAIPEVLVYKSSDGGRAWHPLSRIVGVNALALTAVGHHEWIMEAQANSPRIFFERSTDNGLHWTRLTLSLPTREPLSVISPRAVWMASGPAKSAWGAPLHVTLNTLRDAPP